MAKKTALVIGGGFAGCASAHQLSLLGGWDVTVVEAAPFLGAGVRTEWFGGHPYTFGPRHLLTHDRRAFDYIHKYCPINQLEHEFLTYVESDNAFYNFPIHRDDVDRMPDKGEIIKQLADRPKEIKNPKDFEDYWIQSVGQNLYNKYVLNYSKKMWMIDDNRKLDTFSWSPKGVALKEGTRDAWDTAITGYPFAADGYNSYFDLAVKEATVLLSTMIETYDIPNKTVVIKGQKKSFDIIINTISPDTLFDNCFGELPYVGRDFHKIVLPMESCFPEKVFFLYYANSESFTRLVEYKRFTGHKSPTTLVGMEIPSANGKFYPVPIKAEQERADKYFALMPDGVFSIGRNGSYRYGIDIDDCILQAMDVIEKLKSR